MQTPIVDAIPNLVLKNFYYVGEPSAIAHQTFCLFSNIGLGTFYIILSLYLLVNSLTVIYHLVLIKVSELKRREFEETGY